MADMLTTIRGSAANSTLSSDSAENHEPLSGSTTEPAKGAEQEQEQEQEQEPGQKGRRRPRKQKWNRDQQRNNNGGRRYSVTKPARDPRDEAPPHRNRKGARGLEDSRSPTPVIDFDGLSKPSRLRCASD